MDQSKEIQMKQHVLNMLHDFMMEGEGGKFKPKSIEVEMTDEPKEGKEGLGDFLKEASAHADEESPMEDKGESEEMEEVEDEPKKMSPREFFKRK
jgi:hypothetical protein